MAQTRTPHRLRESSVRVTALVLTDDRARSQRLAARSRAFGSHSLHDLYGDEPLAKVRPRTIVSDVLKPTSETMGRLQRALATVRGSSTPLIWLLHENSAREQMQARALNASRLIMISSLVDEDARSSPLIEKGGAPPPSVLRKAAQRTGELLFNVLYRGRTITPAALEAGAVLVLDAVREEGVQVWLELVRQFDDATLEHCLTVAGLAAAQAMTLSLGQADASRLTQAALLHDVGKSRVPRQILNKPGPLDADERRAMREHPALGHAMLRSAGFDASLLTVVRSHHEYLDGSGYPDALRGGEIPDLVRLVTVCDVFSALIERRPYRAPMAGRDAYATVLNMSRQLDPDIVRAFRPVAEAFR